MEKDEPCAVAKLSVSVGIFTDFFSHCKVTGFI